MTVKLSGGMSVIIRKDKMGSGAGIRTQLLALLGDVLDEDQHLVVFGPLFSTQELDEPLKAIGLEYYEDWFDLPHTGGTVPEWCMFELSLRVGADLMDPD